MQLVSARSNKRTRVLRGSNSTRVYQVDDRFGGDGSAAHSTNDRTAIDGLVPPLYPPYTSALVVTEPAATELAIVTKNAESDDADVRIVRRRTRGVSAWAHRISGVSHTRVVAIGTRRTPIKIDPFAVAVAETVETLLGSRCSALAVTGAPFVSFSVDKCVMITADLFDPEVAVLILTSDGSPTQCVVWFENSGVNNFDFDRYSTYTDKNATTSSGGLTRNSAVTSSLSTLAGSTQRDSLVTRFSHLRPVNQRTILYTGLTRGSTYLIENDTITKPMKNRRFDSSPIFMVQPIKVRDFNFTNLSGVV